jgi:hypothetical protein
MKAAKEAGNSSISTRIRQSYGRDWKQLLITRGALTTFSCEQQRNTRHHRKCCFNRSPSTAWRHEEEIAHQRDPVWGVFPRSHHCAHLRARGVIPSAGAAKILQQSSHLWRRRNSAICWNQTDDLFIAQSPRRLPSRKVCSNLELNHRGIVCDCSLRHLSLIVYGAGQLSFPHAANGSLIEGRDQS